MVGWNVPCETLIGRYKVFSVKSCSTIRTMVIVKIAAMAVRPGGPGCLTWFKLEDRMLIFLQ